MKMFRCPDCKGNRLEEILEGVTLYSEIMYVTKEDGKLVIEYHPHNYNVESNNDCSAYYQCMECGREVPVEELEKCALPEFE